MNLLDETRVEGEPEDLPHSVFNLPDDTDIPDPQQSQETQETVQRLVMKRDVEWYSEGASFVQKEEGVEIHPEGEPTLGTLIGESDPNGYFDPESWYVRVPGNSIYGFDPVYQLSRGGHIFGSLEDDKGSMAFLKEGVEVDPEAKVIKGLATDVIDYVQYGRESIPYLPGYRLSG